MNNIKEREFNDNYWNKMYIITGAKILFDLKLLEVLNFWYQYELNDYFYLVAVRKFGEEKSLIYHYIKYPKILLDIFLGYLCTRLHPKNKTVYEDWG